MQDCQEELLADVTGTMILFTQLILGTPPWIESRGSPTRMSGSGDGVFPTAHTLIAKSEVDKRPVVQGREKGEQMINSTWEERVHHEWERKERETRKKKRQKRKAGSPALNCMQGGVDGFQQGTRILGTKPARCVSRHVREVDSACMHSANPPAMCYGQ